jgi:hypothetical protein
MRQQREEETGEEVLRAFGFVKILFGLFTLLVLISQCLFDRPSESPPVQQPAAARTEPSVVGLADLRAFSASTGHGEFVEDGYRLSSVGDGIPAVATTPGPGPSAAVSALVEPDAVDAAPPAETALAGPACVTSVFSDAGFAFLVGPDGTYRLVRFDPTGLSELTRGRRPELTEPRPVTLTCRLLSGGTALTVRSGTDQITSWVSDRRGNDVVSTGVVLVSPVSAASVVVREFRSYAVDID